MAFQDQFSYYGPTRLFMGRGSIGNIPELLAEQGLKKALIVTDQGLVDAGLVGHITALLDLANIAHSTFSNVAPNPPIKNVTDCTAQYQTEGCDHLIAIGGGLQWMWPKQRVCWSIMVARFLIILLVQVAQ